MPTARAVNVGLLLNFRSAGPAPGNSCWAPSALQGARVREPARWAAVVRARLPVRVLMTRSHCRSARIRRRTRMEARLTSKRAATHMPNAQGHSVHDRGLPAPANVLTRCLPVMQRCGTPTPNLHPTHNMVTHEPRPHRACCPPVAVPAPAACVPTQPPNPHHIDSLRLRAQRQPP